ncbi:type II secretion system protein GspD [Rhodoferax sp.]|uniref:type II secretion system protein GspD n=1 Tax=Rhodoferax sp. TaxID=50421 RepID=UPI002743F163|nr:type II and III secretion system protein [Rhodoferax sp.]
MTSYPVCDALSVAHAPKLERGLFLGLLALLGACAAPPAPPPSAQHLTPGPQVAGRVPDFAVAPPLPRPPRPSVRQELYSVVMSNVNVQDLLFALARDAKLNVDIHPSITGTVTMNVHDQTLTEILDRVARQVDLRYEMEGKNLSIQPDSPYLKHYRVDYPNIQRDVKTTIGTSSSAASTGGAGGGGGGSNGSSTAIENTSNNRFWASLIANLTDLLRETDKILPEGNSETVTQQAAVQSTTGTGTPGPATRASNTSSPAVAAARALASSVLPAALTSAGTSVVRRSTFREAASVIAHPETGNVSVRATQSQHAKVREFIDRVLSSARRQVLIEATIVEVDLSNRYQQGIDWSVLQTGGANAGSSITLRPAGDASVLQTGGVVGSMASLGFKQFRLWGGDTDLSAMLSLLESFGTMRVLSSPKVSVLNNQTSVLKVVDNKVYFSISVTPGTAATATAAATAATYTTTINTVPIGFLMTVVPQISEGNEVTLNLRPTISRITGYATDPNPVLAQNNVINRIPEVQTREIESILRVQSGDIAVLGGLMQDARNKDSDEVPGLNRVSMLGELFKYRNDSNRKTELVIFLRPTVLMDASIDADLRDFRSTLPNSIEAMRGMGDAGQPTPPSARN